MMLQDSMWNAKSDRLPKARAEAREAHSRNEFVSAHSIMLSAYITIMAGGQSAVKSLYYTLLALWHTFVLLRNWRKLSHNQLDVLIQFCLKFRSQLPFFKSGQVLRVHYWYTQPDRFLLALAKREVEIADEKNAKPHQQALAYMTYAETTYAVNFRRSVIEDYIEKALALESEIRAEASHPQGLRQLVRVLRKAGELQRDMSNTSMSIEYWHQALNLARGEADATDQVKRIESLL